MGTNRTFFLAVGVQTSVMDVLASQTGYKNPHDTYQSQGDILALDLLRSLLDEVKGVEIFVEFAGTYRNDNPHIVIHIEGKKVGDSANIPSRLTVGLPSDEEMEILNRVADVLTQRGIKHEGVRPVTLVEVI